jgi:alkylated DNA repair dioxygenase AlkB
MLELETLVDDDSGTIVYRRDLFDAARCGSWFEALRLGVDWRAERRPMYDRVVDVPRLVASFDLADPAVPDPLREMQPAVEAFCGVRFASAGLNFYRDGGDSVAPHGDHVENDATRSPVALVSLGSTRRMTIRSRVRPRRVFDRDLEQGSLLVMSHASHFNYDHGIPKTRTAVGPRISIAFRGIRRSAMRARSVKEAT